MSIQGVTKVFRTSLMYEIFSMGIETFRMCDDQKFYFCINY